MKWTHETVRITPTIHQYQEHEVLAVMTTPLLCGIDAGTGSIRAVVVSTDGIIMASASTPTPLVEDGDDHAHHDADALFAATLFVLHEVTAGLGERAADIVAITVASVGEAGVLIDEAGTPLCPMLAWYDYANRSAIRSVDERVRA